MVGNMQANAVGGVQTKASSFVPSSNVTEKWEQELEEQRRVAGELKLAEAPQIEPPKVNSGAMSPKITAFRSSFAQLSAEGETPTEETVARARTAAIDLVQTAIRQGQPELIANVRNAIGAEAFTRQLQSVDINPYYVSASERIITAAKAGDVQTLKTVKGEVSSLLKEGNLRYVNQNSWAAPLWYAADAAERQIKSGQPYDVNAQSNPVASRRWLNGLGVKSQMTPLQRELLTWSLMPGILVDKTVTGTADHLGNFAAYWKSPVEAPDGGVWAGWDKDGNQRILYRNPLTGQDLWLDAQDPIKSLSENGTVFALSAFGISRTPPLRTPAIALPLATKYRNLEITMERLGPEGARAHIQALRMKGATESDDILTTMLAARDTPTKQAVLKEFGDDFANIDLNAFRRPDGTPLARTADQRYALANILAQNPKLTPQQFAHMQDMSMLSNSVYPKVKGDPSQGLRETVPPHYERVTDFSKHPKLERFSDKDFKDPNTGLYSDLFYNKTDGSYTLVFRGSVSGKNAISNARQAAGFYDRQYQQAMDLGQDLKTALGQDFAGVTGHSKGGGQAAAVSMRTETPAITFNAAGLHHRTVQRAGGMWDESRITNFSVEGEVLTYVQEDQLITRYAVPSAAGNQTRIQSLDASGHFIEFGAISGTELHKMHSVIPGMLINAPAR